MKEAVLVHVSEALHELEHDVLDDALGKQVIAPLHQLVQVLVHVLEYHVEVVVVAYDLFEANYVRVANFL